MNRKKLVITSPLMLEHIPPFIHAENPDRLEAIIKMLHSSSCEILTEYPPVSESIINLAHTREHLGFVKQSHSAKLQILDDGDTYCSRGSLQAAYMAAGAGVTGMDKIFQEEYNRVFCAVRPPGHHAETNKVMGFCYFNNIAVAVRYALDKGYIKTAAIVDWDVHHGNGTQEIFYSEKSVLFFSLHQMPLWPGTGSNYESGEGNGIGYTINFPITPHSGIDIYKNHFEDTIIPKIRDFNPDILCISAGFDAHKDDPLAQVDLQSEDYILLTQMLTELADELTIPVLSMLEGGYNIPALTESVKNHISAL